MRVELKLHPDSICEAVAGVEASIERTSGGMAVHFTLHGRLADIRMPSLGASKRADELWRHTCFEAFARVSQSYYEFNLSPSGEWATYRFEGYRQGMGPAAIEPARIVVTGEDGHASGMIFEHMELGDLPSSAAWRIGLSAVIEETNGRLSYWALHHPPGKPDFHHPDCFALELPPPSGA